MKRYSILFSPHAIKDIESACTYYEQQQRNLSKRFARQVEKALQSIKTNPLYYGVRYDSIRCARVDKFPFLIHYTIEEESKAVMVLAVYSTHQEPLWDN